MTWHADQFLAPYAAGTLPAARASSVEAHLMACETCRIALADHVDTRRVEQVWHNIVVELHAPRPTPIETLLLRLGVSEATARLLAATPALSLPWLGAMAFALTFSLLAAHTTGTRGVLAFLLLAPVLPAVGVAASYGHGIDPLHELTVAAPMATFRLLLLRTMAVLGASSVLTGLAALALPVHGWVAAAWLLPSLALTVASLALGRWAPLHWASGGLAAAWFTVVVITARPFRPGALLLAGPFSGAGQLACLTLAAAGAALLMLGDGGGRRIPPDDYGRTESRRK